MTAIRPFIKRLFRLKAALLTFIVSGFALGLLQAQTSGSETRNTAEPVAVETNAMLATPLLQIDAGKVTGKVSPTLYGLMTEEVDYSYGGGLYGELVRNRSYKVNPERFVLWIIVGDGVISPDRNQPLNAALNVSLKLNISKASKTSPVGTTNEAFWGIPMRPNTTYHASFYAKAEHFQDPLTVALESPDGKTVLPARQRERNHLFESG